jgi:hypothetical protein
MAAGYDPPSASLHPAGGAGVSRTEQDVMQDDLAAILRELGLGDHARPLSAHQVVQTEVLPMIRAWRMALAAAGAPVHESLVHCGPACACGVNEAGQFYRDPLCASRRDRQEVQR